MIDEPTANPIPQAPPHPLSTMSNEELAYHVSDVLWQLKERVRPSSAETSEKFNELTTIALSHALHAGAVLVRFHNNPDVVPEFVLAIKGLEGALEYERKHCQTCNDTGAINTGKPCPACNARDPF